MRSISVKRHFQRFTILFPSSPLSTRYSERQAALRAFLKVSEVCCGRADFSSLNHCFSKSLINIELVIKPPSKFIKRHLYRSTIFFPSSPLSTRYSERQAALRAFLKLRKFDAEDEDFSRRTRHLQSLKTKNGHLPVKRAQSLSDAFSTTRRYFSRQVPCQRVTANVRRLYGHF